MTDKERLSDWEVERFLRYGPALDKLEEHLPETERNELIGLQAHAADYLASDNPDYIASGRAPVLPPAIAEVQRILGNAYLALPEGDEHLLNRSLLRQIMHDLHMTPSAPKEHKNPWRNV